MFVLSSKNGLTGILNNSNTINDRYPVIETALTLASTKGFGLNLTKESQAFL